MTDLNSKLIACSDSWKKIFSFNNNLSLIDNFNEIGNEILLVFDQILQGEFEKHLDLEKVYQNETIIRFKLKFTPWFQLTEIGGFLITANVENPEVSVLESPEILHKKFNDAFSYSIIGMALISLSGKWIEMNEKVCDLVGYSKEELQELSFQEITHPEDLRKDLDLLDSLFRGEIPSYQTEKRYYHKDGKVVWVNLAVSLVRDENGAPSYFVSQIEDLSTTKKAQETIRENENIFKSIFHSSYQFTALLTKEGKIREINNAALGFFGLSHKECSGKAFWEIPNWLVSKNLPGKVKKNIEKAAAGEFINYEERLWDENKDEVIIDFTLKPVFNEKGKVVSVIAEGMLIQEMIDARIKLLESERKLRSFFNLSPVGFVVNDLETGNFIELNDSILDNTGYTKEEFLNFNYWNLFPEEYRWMEPLVIERLKETGIFGPVQLEYARKDGIRFPILINGMITKDRDGKDQIWTVVQDITELKLKEQELQKLNDEIESQNLLLSASNNELEQFAYVASHDLQEPLRMITGFLSLLDAKYKDQLDEKAREYIHYAVDGASRMRQIIIDILEYSKIDKDETELQVTDLEQTLKTVTQLLSGMITDKNAEISWDGLPEILGQKAPLHQLFSNLLSNALKYQSPEVPPKINISVDELEDKWKFCVSDNGIGISEEFHVKIFDIFCRLNGKRDYEGTGIGLALCKKVVEKHGGEIWVESALNEGSRFYFTLEKQ